VKILRVAVPMLLLASFASAEEAPAVVSGEAGLSYVQTTGNSSNSTIGAGLKLLRQAGAWKTGLNTAFVRTESESVKTAERFDTALRAERGFGDGFAAYAQGSYLRNTFAGIEGQETFESGGLYKFANGPKQFFSASAALSYTAEQRIAPDRDRNFVGGRAALAYKWQLSASADFTEDLDYLQSFKESADGRLSHKAAVTANVSKIFALKLAHQLLYYNAPAPGKQKTDTTILASIVAKWPAPPPPPPPCPCPPK
jgi:putative salt-induced outer membrane protein